MPQPDLVFVGDLSAGGSNSSCALSPLAKNSPVQQAALKSQLDMGEVLLPCSDGSDAVDLALPAGPGWCCALSNRLVLARHTWSVWQSCSLTRER